MYVYGNGEKSRASLNAPLLHYIFRVRHDADYIVHYHEQHEELDTYPYAPPGTVRDSMRDNFRMVDLDEKTASFNIENHGCILIFDKEGKMI